MKTNNVQGKNIAVIIGLYLFAKTILNMVIGGGFDIKGLVGDVVLFVALFSGLQYLNYAVTAILAIVVVVNLPDNITHIGSNWIYLIEAVVDVVCAVILCTNPSVDKHFTNKWSEISTLFNK
ncbi:MAG: hypothetical protein K2K91_04560 [Ruminococcus sp.]|nr:hypothetical protein [Ruminococcus sp.]